MPVKVDMERERIIFLIYPTWFCNFKCPYCVASHLVASNINGKEHIPSMFDAHTLEDWIKAIENFGAQYDIEFYFSGGDPLCVPQTFDFLKRLVCLPYVKYIRLDHNMSKVKKLIEVCPSDKLQVNGSWHPIYLDYNFIHQRARELNEHNMLAMINFVASDENEQYLSEHDLTLEKIVLDMEADGIFFNIATDIHKRDDKDYMDKYVRYISPQDQSYLSGTLPSYGVPCMAPMKYFTVEWDGQITTCKSMEDCLGADLNGQRIVGNFFAGKLDRKMGHCKMKCSNCIVMYTQRLDNAFDFDEHLRGYKKRTEQWRKITRSY